MCGLDASAICFAIAVPHRPASVPVRSDPPGRPLDQFHDERRRAVALLQTVNGCDVRMIEPGKHFGFALETRNRSLSAPLPRATP